MRNEDLKIILDGDIDHIDKVNKYDISTPDLGVTISPIQVKKMLLKYLNNEISDVQINKWADFLIHRSGNYLCENWEIDEIADFYEDMFYVVQKLSTPELDGKITPELVEEYLRELDKYFKTNDLEY